MSVTIVKTYLPPPFCEREIFRYAGGGAEDEGTRSAVLSCIEEAKGALIYKVCYRELPVFVEGNECDFGVFSLSSNSLAKNLSGCQTVILFAATVGVGIDRMIGKYGRLSPSRALLMQAIGAERIESLCGLFCREIQKEKGLLARPRFSPGYGDLPLETQRTVFELLDCPKKIGAYLNESLLISPTKTVTAFLGFGATVSASNEEKCRDCGQQSCIYRDTK
ncbi:MAG: Vitamin B12 dependent methionine synthase activation subunit [Clostridia bacterium]|nr:Vitamin B12 dependent methionine synthase activation subunit [Clostridia bacterium]